MTSLQSAYPWTQSPLIVSAPMRLISTAALAVAVSRAGGLGFLAGGTDTSTLATSLRHARELLEKGPIANASISPLPIGVGVITWALKVEDLVEALRENPPAAIWLFAPPSSSPSSSSNSSSNPSSLAHWTSVLRASIQPAPQIIMQVGSLSTALHAAHTCAPDALVLQGTDAGGHGLARGASIVSLVPEVHDALAAAELSIPLIATGGIADHRGVAAALALGAQGAAMGTAFLVAEEAAVAKGYRETVLHARDGGQSTVRTSVYDRLRGTVWPESYNARGVINASFEDAERGVDEAETRRLYAEAMRRGDEGWLGWEEDKKRKEGRVAAYAGTGVGLVRGGIVPARTIVERARGGVREVLEGAVAGAVVRGNKL
ncbi:MAG: hypothetical protein M1819_004379 [Sarea resinae]|nr:MAG: hypothetical protein M1819_004379 [Sarea resinae]